MIGQIGEGKSKSYRYICSIFSSFVNLICAINKIFIWLYHKNINSGKRDPDRDLYLSRLTWRCKIWARDVIKKTWKDSHIFFLPICFESCLSIGPSFYQFVSLLNISCGLSFRGHAPTAHTYSITKHRVYWQTSLTASQKECYGGILMVSLHSFTLSVYRGMC